MPREPLDLQRAEPIQILNASFDYTATIVTDMTPIARESAREVTRAKHVEPAQVVMRYSIGFLTALVVVEVVVLFAGMASQWPPLIILGAMFILAAIAAPVGLAVAKLAPKLIEGAATAGGTALTR
jgi:ABC-type polysaccharide/polyol phosphate export permease